MPNIKSAIKRVRIGTKKTAVNKNKKSELRTVLKKAEAAVSSSAADAAEIVRTTQAKLDRAASKGLISKNKAARKKSQIAKKLNV